MAAVGPPKGEKSSTETGPLRGPRRDGAPPRPLKGAPGVTGLSLSWDKPWWVSKKEKKKTNGEGKRAPPNQAGHLPWQRRWQERGTQRDPALSTGRLRAHLLASLTFPFLCATRRDRGLCAGQSGRHRQGYRLHCLPLFQGVCARLL